MGRTAFFVIRMVHEGLDEEPHATGRDSWREMQLVEEGLAMALVDGRTVGTDASATLIRIVVDIRLGSSLRHSQHCPIILSMFIVTRC